MKAETCVIHCSVSENTVTIHICGAGSHADVWDSISVFLVMPYKKSLIPAPPFYPQDFFTGHCIF